MDKEEIEVIVKTIMEQKEPKSIIEKNVVVLFGILIASFLTGTFSMVYTNNKNNEVFETRLKYLSDNIAVLNTTVETLRGQIQDNTNDRWSRADHSMYSLKIDKDLDKINDRLLRLESSKK